MGGRRGGGQRRAKMLRCSDSTFSRMHRPSLQPLGCLSFPNRFVPEHVGIDGEEVGEEQEGGGRLSSIIFMLVYSSAPPNIPPST